MILDFDTDDSYLSELGEKICAADCYYMTNKCQKDFNNGAIDVLSTIIKHVMSSASEAETGVLYYGYKRAIPYIVMLQEMGHPQLEPTPLTIDNNTAHVITMGTMNSKASKSNDMRLQWLKIRKAQQMFAFLWARCDNTGPDWGPYSGIQVDEVTAYLETSPSVLMVLRYAFYV